jgi:hypothetical protein
MFGRGNWEPGVATIVERARKTSMGANPMYHYAADIQPHSGGPAFRAALEQPLLASTFRPPGIGQTVKVKVDRERGIARFDRSDPALSIYTAEKERRKAQRHALEESLHETPGQSGSTVAQRRGDMGEVARLQAKLAARTERTPGAEPVDSLERLERLAALHDRGVLTDAEFAAEKAKILEND